MKLDLKGKKKIGGQQELAIAMFAFAFFLCPFVTLFLVFLWTLLARERELGLEW